jgi:hypothetical protein
VRVWEVIPHINTTTSKITESKDNTNDADPLEIRRVTKLQTNVADVSSMAVFETAGEEGDVAKMLVCGVGMEVVRVVCLHV